MFANPFKASVPSPALTVLIDEEDDEIAPEDGRRCSKAPVVSGLEVS